MTKEEFFGGALTPAAESMAEEHYDFDFDLISMTGAKLGGGDDGYISHCDMEEEEEKEDVQTESGSLAMADKDFSVFEQLDARKYDDYRFLLLGEARGVEHYIIKKFSFLRSFPVTRDFWLGIQQFSNMHKTIQLDGIEVRKRAIRFLFARKRYNFWYDQGRVQPGESDMVEEWLAANYGWGEPTELQPSAGPNDVEDDCSPSDGPVRIIDDRDGGEESEESEGGGHEDPPMVTEEGAALSSDAATGSSPTLPVPKSEAKGKCGGNGRMVEYYHDPLVNDKADGHV